MRRCAILFALLGVPAGLHAKEAEVPFLLFREADPATAKRIRDLITEKQLGGQVPDTRRQTRETLARIGPWCVPFLATALKKQSSARIRLNAVLALMLIRDPRGLPAIREAAKEDDDRFVRRAATLALATFETQEDLKTLRELQETPRADWRTIAPALARLRHKDAPAVLEAALARLPRDDEHAAAAIVLAAAIGAPRAPLLGVLEKGEKLAQEAAAAGLAVRPLPASRSGELLAAFERTRGHARVLAVRALGAIDPRPADVQGRLLDLACRDGDAPVRIAALLELQGAPGEYELLARAYRKVAERNDPIAAHLLLALARTRDPKALETLLDVVRTGSDYLRFHAGASLLLVQGTEVLEDPALSAVRGIGGDLQTFAGRLGRPDEAARKAAAADLRDELGDFAMGRSERNWQEVNRLMARILELVPVLNQFDASKAGRTQETPLGGPPGGEEGRKAPSGSPEQQDLFDLLLPPGVAPPKGEPAYPERRPYFGPEDLAVG